MSSSPPEKTNILTPLTSRAEARIDRPIQEGGSWYPQELKELGYEGNFAFRKAFDYIYELRQGLSAMQAAQGRSLPLTVTDIAEVANPLPDPTSPTPTSEEIPPWFVPTDNHNFTDGIVQSPIDSPFTNRVLAVQWFLPFDFPLNVITTSVEATGAGNNYGVGLYDINLNRFLQTGPLSMTQGVNTTNLSITIPKGIYYYAWTASNSGGSIWKTGNKPASTRNVDTWNSHQIIFSADPDGSGGGGTAGPGSSGNLPATLTLKNPVGGMTSRPILAVFWQQ